jgi:site-specific recombinase XerC
MTTTKAYTPQPVFDTLDETLALYQRIQQSMTPYAEIKLWLSSCLSQPLSKISDSMAQDFRHALTFLYSYRGSPDTFRAYRREVERLCQWCWFFAKKPIIELNRIDIESFIEFCIKPAKTWIGFKTVARFKKTKDGLKETNEAWRPFTATKKQVIEKDGEKKLTYQLSEKTLKVIFGIIGSFYAYLLQEEATTSNPVALIRQKSKFLRKDTTAPTIRRLSDKQWERLLAITKTMADKDARHERVLFIVQCLYRMYLRISELTASDRWTPTMHDFFQDHNDNWWFKTVGKGNKARQIAVSAQMLEAFKRYRQYLGLPALPTADEQMPLIGKLKNPYDSITDTRWVRRLVQECFDSAANSFTDAQDQHDFHQLQAATVHWLRHTGISDDVKIRPREHVRDDAGHSSGAITDLYIDVELQARADSAKKKK